MAKPLVIVESPAKAKTLGRFLGRQYNVVASFGHIRDLPESASQVPASIKDKDWGRLGVDVEGSFTPYYVVPADKKKYVQALKTALKDASEVLLATDPDREGESISWHLREVLRPRVPIRRIVFHEITEAAVREAMAHAGEIDEKLVDAQEARRILDRLYGYTLSPVLWKKVQTGLSAGRVQSVAVRLIVEREEARRRFGSARYWDLEANLAGQGREFVARLVRIGDRKVATGQDFDAQGRLTSGQAHHVDEDQARHLAPTLQARLPWSVTRVDAKPGTERPAPPFTTSTLTQEAARKLGFSTKRTMDVAQRLFQGVEVGGGQMEGLITYHRTDSTTLSEKALHEAERFIRERFGPDYYEGPRRYQTRVKNAQEAHEAIRPTDFALAPQQLQALLEPDEWKLYDLVWKRTMASQMADARVVRTAVDITAAGPDGTPHVFQASGKAIEFAGFRRAYVEGSDDPDAELEDQESLLPRLATGDTVVGDDGGGGALALKALRAVGHETQPPPRYTEASLIKELEKAGIGRPSTYAPTIETIISRGYVFRQRNTLVPSFTAFAVTALLREHFSDYVDVGFTAEMEEDLDEISNGDRDRLQFLRQFFLDGDGKHPGLEPKVKSVADQVAYPAIDIGECPETGEPLRVRIGRFGPFLQRGSGGPGNTASVPDDLTPADLTVDRALELLKAKAAGPRALGADPQTGATVYVNNGRFGPYVQLGEAPETGQKGQKPKRASLLSFQREDNLTLEDALRLLELPRAIGTHPDDGEPVVASPGRFGPYVKHGSEFRSLASDDQIFTVTLDEAVDLLRQPKRSRRREPTARRVLRELGSHPTSGKPLQMLDGRYGPYVTDGETNASLPKGANPEALTLEEALGMLASRAEARPKRRRPVRSVKSARSVRSVRKKTAS